MISNSRRTAYDITEGPSFIRGPQGVEAVCITEGSHCTLLEAKQVSGWGRQETIYKCPHRALSVDSRTPDTCPYKAEIMKEAEKLV